jgi:hypothetical protein
MVNEAGFSDHFPVAITVTIELSAVVSRHSAGGHQDPHVSSPEAATDF